MTGMGRGRKFVVAEWGVLDPCSSSPPQIKLNSTMPAHKRVALLEHLVATPEDAVAKPKIFAEKRSITLEQIVLAVETA